MQPVQTEVVTTHAGEPHSSSPRRPRERVHEQVIRAAHQLIETGGYTALTVDALVAASGISKKTVYRWWNNRADVALDMAALSYGEPDAVGDGPILQRVQQFVQAEARYLLGPAGPVLAGILGDAQRRPALAATVENRYFAVRRSALSRLLVDAADQSAAGMTSDSDTDLVATVLLAPLYQSLLTGHPPLTEELADRIVALVLSGVRGQDSA